MLSREPNFFICRVFLLGSGDHFTFDVIYCLDVFASFVPFVLFREPRETCSTTGSFELPPHVLATR